MASDQELSQFITNVGLITTNGKHGHNITAIEWTHHISYEPNLITVCIRKGKASYENILATKEFGVNIASRDQRIVSSISGNSSRKFVDKIGLLKELGISFYKAKNIDVYMVTGASMNVECKVVKIIDIGDHPLIIGEAVNIIQIDKSPLIYYKGKYWSLGEHLHKPPEDVLTKIDKLKQKYTINN